MNIFYTRALLLAIVVLILLKPSPAATQAQDIPTYANEIARIFQNRCQECHYPNAPFAPMSLMSYGEIRPWVKAIHKQVAMRSMPPWHANPEHGNFSNDRSLSEEEIDAIIRWTEARAPRGNPSDLPEPQPVPGKWRLGAPDVILDTGEDFAVPASGVLPFEAFAIDTDFGEDKWLSGLEAQPGNRDVVKEIVVYVKNPKGGVEIPDAGPLGNGRLGFYSRGLTASRWGEGRGKLVKQGAQIIVGVLYVPNGTATTDRSRVGLYFHEEPAGKHVITRGISETKFEIEPHIPDFPIYAIYEFDRDATLLSMRPEMHYRGSGFKFIGHFPDGRDEILLHVDRYDYEWQTYYYPGEPIKLPAGTVLECIGIMDNSHENYKNPGPHAVVRYGDQPTDEKMIGWIDYTLDRQE